MKRVERPRRGIFKVPLWNMYRQKLHTNRLIFNSHKILFSMYIVHLKILKNFLFTTKIIDNMYDRQKPGTILVKRFSVKVCLMLASSHLLDKIGRSFHLILYQTIRVFWSWNFYFRNFIREIKELTYKFKKIN